MNGTTEKNQVRFYFDRKSVVMGILLAAMVCTQSLQGEDWPEWRGKGRLGVWKETGILQKFPSGGLKFKWRTPVKAGYAGPAISDGRVFVLDYQETPESRTMDGTERLLCLDEKTGKVLWTHEWPTSYRMLMASYAIGPRATPTVDGNRVYVVGATGVMHCLDVRTGEVIWKKNYVDDYGTSIATWGVVSSPLVDGQLLICVVGGEPNAKVVAFDKMTGQEVWRALSSDSEMGYGQPVIFEAGGKRQLIIWHPKALSSLNPKTGKIYWEHPFDVRSGMTVATPVRSQDYLVVTQFYGGSMMLQLDDARPGASLMWKGKSNSELPDQTDGLHALITTPIIQGDYVYGVCSYGHLRCLNAKTGERVWETLEMTELFRWAAAFMVRNGDRYFINNDKGDLIIARFNPQGYVEVDRTRLLEPTSNSAFGRVGRNARNVNWSHPAYANQHIFARNDEEIVCASLQE